MNLDGDRYDWMVAHRFWFIVSCASRIWVWVARWAAVTHDGARAGDKCANKRVAAHHFLVLPVAAQVRIPITPECRGAR